ncbi:MAG: branched-chain amino acid ABC transporter permease [Pseudomonadota bacterium]
MMNKTVNRVFWAAILVFVAIYPMLFGIYFTNVFVSFAIHALFAVSFNLLLGFTGLLSFGHAMYFGMGGYATALALSHIPGCPLMVALLIGFMASVALALILCPIVVRVSGAAFSMLHLAFAQLMYVLALKLRGITGGEDGIGGFPIPPFRIPGIVSIDMTNPLNFYYFAMAVLGVSLWILWFFTKTPFGQIMVGIRDNVTRVDYTGFKVPQTKAVIYAFAGGFAGVAGSIYAMFNDLISADGALHIMVSFAPILMTMVGGVGSFFGPICGSAIFGLLEELTTRYTERVELVSGVILIAVILFFPMGFMGLLKVIKEKWFSKRLGKGATEDDS